MTLPAPYGYDAGYLFQTIGNSGALPAQITLKGTLYAVRPELRCSLVAVKRLSVLLAQRDGGTVESAEVKILAALELLVTKHHPVIIQYLREVRLVSQPVDGRQSVIIMTKVSNLTELFAGLSVSLKLEVPVQPTHVTLYTLPGKGPVGVTSPAELEGLSRPLDQAGLDEWHKQIDMIAQFGVTRG